ncbi:MAG: hypothetical protein ACP5UO_00055 [Thermoplasmata archaeon]
MYCLLKIAYDNSFHGFQAQPGIRTVQGEMLEALRPIGITRIYASSRTDSHVRSAGTIVEMEHDDVQKVCRIVDSLKGIAVLGYATREKFVNLRSGIMKTYWYLSPFPTDGDSLDAAICEFMAGSVSSFSKDRNRKVILDGISKISGSSFTLLIFSGRAFSWNFVRIAGETIVRRALGEIGDGEWGEMLQGIRRSRFRGKAENLILVDSRSEIMFKGYPSAKIAKIRASILPEVAWASLLDGSVAEFASDIGSHRP